jgi:hypothetical protein
MNTSVVDLKPSHRMSAPFPKHPKSNAAFCGPAIIWKTLLCDTFWNLRCRLQEPFVGFGANHWRPALWS